MFQIIIIFVKFIITNKYCPMKFKIDSISENIQKQRRNIFQLFQPQQARNSYFINESAISFNRLIAEMSNNFNHQQQQDGELMIGMRIDGATGNILVSVGKQIKEKVPIVNNKSNQLNTILQNAIRYQEKIQNQMINGYAKCLLKANSNKIYHQSVISLMREKNLGNMLYKTTMNFIIEGGESYKYKSKLRRVPEDTVCNQQNSENIEHLFVAFESYKPSCIFVVD